MNDLIALIEPYMFTPENMNAIALTQITTTCKKKEKEKVDLTKPMPTVALPPTVAVPTIAPVITPSFVVKDKLFLQFYTLLHGLPMVLAQKANWFFVEKQFKIATVEQLLKHDKEYKVALRAQKLKVAECEDDLVTAAQIGLPGLYALCLVHDISLLYVQDRKYMHMGKNDPTAILKANKDLSSVELVEGVDVHDIYANYWEMESIHKLLRSPSAYTLAELQEIVRRLAPEIETGTMKKSALYSLILEKL